MAHECIEENIEKGNLDKEVSIAIKDYNLAVLHGIVKIAAKMGISTLQSYQSAQIFEAVGISQEVIDQYFTNTISTVGGIGLKQIEEDLTYHHKRAFDVLGLKTDMSLDSIDFTSFVMVDIPKIIYTMLRPLPCFNKQPRQMTISF